MRRLVTTLVFFCGAVLTYQGYLTSRPDVKVRAQSRTVVCKGQPDATCPVKDSDMRSAEMNSFGHRYRWSTGAGDVWVNCRRKLIVWGAWSCELG